MWTVPFTATAMAWVGGGALSQRKPTPPLISWCSPSDCNYSLNRFLIWLLNCYQEVKQVSPDETANGRSLKLPDYRPA